MKKLRFLSVVLCGMLAFNIIAYGVNLDIKSPSVSIEQEFDKEAKFIEVVDFQIE